MKITQHATIKENFSSKTNFQTDKFAKMDRFARGFFGIAVLISLIQTLQAISKDEYNRRISAIKSKPEVAQFLNDNNFMMSQQGVFYEKGADVFTHIRKTKAGAETMDHIEGELETILKQERTYRFMKTILKAVREVLTSKVGIQNIFAVASFVQDELEIPKLFDMCISLKKLLIYLLVSKNGLDAVVKLTKHIHSLENSPNTAPLLAMLDANFPIISVPVIYVEREEELEPVQIMKDIPILENFPPENSSLENAPPVESSLENIPPKSLLKNVPPQKSLWNKFRIGKKDKSEKQSKSETSNKSRCFFCRKKKKTPNSQE